MRRFAVGSVLVDIELKKIDTLLPGKVNVRYHAMEWGDDPSRELTDPLAGYWRELDGTGNPLAAGAQCEQDQGSASTAVKIAEDRFRAKQATKRVNKGTS
jgi:hypothetical protein